MEPLSGTEIREAVRRALAEDIGSGDVTTLSVVPEHAVATADMVAREPLVVAGLELARVTFAELSPALHIQLHARDGDHLATGAPLLTVSGAARAILTAERTALNFVQRLSGIATLTARFVTAVADTPVKILDTRKTTPGWRRFEKYAVACGGGTNHRHGLFDLILIKDNHLATLASGETNPVATAVQRARKQFPQLRVEVEADTLEQVRAALAVGADIILLDNMNLEELRAAVALTRGQAKLEASGGVRLETVRAIAGTGVDFISAGALTHSARSVDIALDFLAGKK